ncbi:MAG: hypothetical protein MUO17_02375 [Dehalococcoidales bacterium]|nr:hypothetical protein [Dehalococcoidales bacterium]
MDLVQVFWTGITIAIVAWIATALLHQNIVALVSTIGISFFLVPMLIIYLRGVVEMQSVSSNMTAMTDIANNTITRVMDYFGNHLPEIVVSDVAGTLVGAVAGLFMVKEG